ncbi:MAG TPA: hypothetical protein VFJ90_05315, partial [Candidatus Didemnitutus sp.]|nr:hypothetical protein [Candidatus Didemnitutus sp.]
PRRHVAAPYHVAPVLRANRLTGSTTLAALSWCGRDRTEATAWQIVSGAAGHWKLNHSKLGGWEIRHWTLPALTGR